MPDHKISLLLRKPAGHPTVKLPSVSSINKPELAGAFGNLRSYLKFTPYTAETGSDKVMADCFGKIIKDGASSVRKLELEAVFKSFAQFPANIAEVARNCAPEWLRVWKALILNESLSYNEARKLLGKEIYIARNQSWNPSFITDIMLAPVSFYLQYGYSWEREDFKGRGVFFLSNKSRRKCALAFLGPRALQPVFADELPEGLAVADFEKSAARDIIYLTGVNSSGSLLNASNALTPAKARSIAKSMASPDFPDFGKYGVPSRNVQMITAYSTLLRNNKIYSAKYSVPTDDIAVFARFAATRMVRELTGADYQALLPGLKGLTKVLTSSSRSYSLASTVIRLICGTPDGEWLSLDNYILRYQCEDNVITDEAAYTGLFPVREFQRAKVSNDETDCLDLWSDITRPFVVNLLRLFCATGLVRLAVDSEVLPGDPMSGLRYLQLTPLGRYAFGIDKEYTPIAGNEDSGPEFDIDDENRIITVLRPDSPYTIFLSQIGRKIGANRFSISATSIVKAASDREDAEYKIATLRKVCLHDPAPQWLDMFKEAMQRAECEDSDGMNYHLVRLDPSVPGLIQLVLSNKEIASQSIKAEGNRLIIPSGFFARFETILHNNGYLL